MHPELQGEAKSASKQDHVLVIPHGQAWSVQISAQKNHQPTLGKPHRLRLQASGALVDL